MKIWYWITLSVYFVGCVTSGSLQEQSEPSTKKDLPKLCDLYQGSVEFSHEMVAALIKHRSGSVLRCFDAVIIRKPSSKGYTKVKFTIGPRGCTRKVEILENDFQVKLFDECLVQVTGKWSYPPPGKTRRGRQRPAD